MAIPKYVSAEEYSRRSGMGVEEVKRQCRLGNIPHMMTEKGYYKIEVYDNNVVSREQYDKVIEENAKLKTTVSNMKSILNQVQI